MARNLFDLVTAYNQQNQGGGYSPFQPDYTNPEDVMRLQTRETLAATPGAESSLVGNAAGNLLSDWGKALKARHEAKKPLNRLKAALQANINNTLENYEAEITNKNPGILPIDAKVQAAQRMLGETSVAKDHPVRKMIRDTAEASMTQHSQFDPEGFQKIADAKAKLASAGVPGDIVNLFNQKTGTKLSVPKNVALAMIKADANWLETGQFESPKDPKVGDKVEVSLPNGDKRQFVYDPEKAIAPDLEHNKGGYADVTELVADREAEKERKAADKLQHTQELQDNRFAGIMGQNFDNLEEVKNYKAVLPVANSAAEAKDTPAGDYNVVNALAKITDPASSVREGEFENARKSATPLEITKGFIAYFDGKGRITAESRKQLMAEINSRVHQYEKAYNLARDVWTERAGQYEIDPNKVVGKHLKEAFPNVSSRSQTAAERAATLLKPH